MKFQAIKGVRDILGKESVAETTAGTGVTVNSVLPGPTESEGVATFVADLATMPHLLIVGPTEGEVKTAAVCAGAGGERLGRRTASA